MRLVRRETRLRYLSTIKLLSPIQGIRCLPLSTYMAFSSSRNNLQEYPKMSRSSWLLYPSLSGASHTVRPYSDAITVLAAACRQCYQSNPSMDFFIFTLENEEESLKLNDFYLRFHLKMLAKPDLPTQTYKYRYSRSLFKTYSTPAA